MSTEHKFVVPPVYRLDEETGEYQMVSSGIDEFGREVPDPMPMAVPVEMLGGLTLADQVRAMVRNEMSRQAGGEGLETFEEADDFDIEDEDFDPKTPYEAVFDPAPAEPADRPATAATHWQDPKTFEWVSIADGSRIAGTASEGQGVAPGASAEQKGGSGGALPPPQGNPGRPAEGGSGSS